MSTLEVRGVDVRRGDRPVVTGATFCAGPGELVALMGASGTGKTTLLRAIAGLDPIDAGTIAIAGICTIQRGTPRGRVPRDLHRAVGMVFQFHHLFEHLTALQNVALAPVHVLGRTRGAAEERAGELLAMLGVGGRAASLPHELSGGEAQRVAIARALAVEPRVLLMDEPTASLDRARRGELGGTLRRLAGQGRTVICATHDQEFARDRAHRVVLLEDGRVVADGAPPDVLA